jgi:hypothetical protein
MANETVSIVIKAFDQTQKALRGIKAAFGKLSKVFFSFKTALVAAVGAGGLGLLISNSLKATDALAKTAGRIGTTTEALSALQYAGQLTGVEVNTMNMALQRFTRRTAEAAVGTGEAQGALRELRLDARKLTRLPLDEQMLTLADAFAEAETRGVNPLKIAFKLFDSEGAALVNTLALGRDGLNDLLGESRRLGVVMSSGAAKGVEDANDALFRMQSLFSGVVKQTVAALAPAISALADLMTNKVLASFDETNEGIQEFAKALAKNAVEGMIAAVQGFENLVAGLVETANQLIIIKAKLTGFFKADDEKDAVQLRLAIEGINEQIAKQIALQETQIGRNKKAAEFTQKRLEAERAVLQKLLDAKKQSGEMDLIDAPSFQEFINIMRQASVAIDGISASTKNLKDSTEGELPSAFETFIQNLNNTREMAGDLTPQLEKLGDQAITGLGRSFTAAITGAEKFSDAIKKMAKSVIDSLIQMLVQKYIVDAAFGAITAGFGGGGTTASGGGGGGVTSVTGALARGGVATGGNPYLVGEKGPEVFVPSTTGRVVPNDQLGGSGVTVVQNINVTTGVQQTVRAEIANLLPQISNAAKSAVADARMRGGGFSKAMVGA